MYEVCLTAQFPLHIWAASMMYFHAFQEYTSEQESEADEREDSLKERARDVNSTASSVDQLMLGITCLLLSVKANENFLNSAKVARIPSVRLAVILDCAARVVLSYAEKSKQVSSERLTKVKKRIKDFVPGVELTIMRIVGNSLVPDTAFSASEGEFSETEVALLVEIYSSIVCLNHSAADISSYVRGQRGNAAIAAAIDRYFIQF